MRFQWSNDLSIQLIESYKTFECLWNPLNVKYKCRNGKQHAWSNLCEITGADEAEVKRKMKNFVAQFHREHKKYGSQKQTVNGESSISKWFAYNHMLFLAGKSKPRRCTKKGLIEIEEVSNTSENNIKEEDSDSQYSNLTHNTDETNSLKATDLSQYITQMKGNKCKPRPSSNVFISSLQSPENPTLNDSQPGPSTTGYSKKIKKHSIEYKNSKTNITPKRKHNEVSDDERQEEAYMMLKEIRNQKPRNRFQVFGEHVALKIESLRTDHAQNTVEHLISNILWEASTGKYDDPFKVDPY